MSVAAAPIHQPPAPALAAAAPLVEAAHASTDAPQRLMASLSSVPMVQRTCASCEGEEEHTMVQPRLEVGAVNDPFEREADDIAGKVMAMRDPGAVTAAAPLVQRACASCSGLDEKVRRMGDPLAALQVDPEDKARMQAEGGGASGESINASASQLTSGGAPLPSGTRDFFEARMGRDLSAVRVHQGGGSQDLNSSIASRAFAYKNHIWLGNRERADANFTMAHELAHVLQQTQPGPVAGEVMAKRAGAKVQRATRNLDEKTYFAPGRNLTPYHDKALQEASRKHNLLGHVAVPNANKSTRFTSSWRSRGVADLVKSEGDKMVGAMAVPWTGPDDARPWYAVTSGSTGSYLMPHKINLNPRTVDEHYRSGAEMSARSANTTHYDRTASPSWDGRFAQATTGTGTSRTTSWEYINGTDFTRDGSTGPSTHAIGDMKFMGGADKTSDARGQVDNYIGGFNFFNRFYDRVRQRGNAALASNSMAGPSGTIADWNFSASKMGQLPNGGALTEAQSGLDLYPYRIAGDERMGTQMSQTSKPGKMYFRQNPDEPVLFEYYFYPNDEAPQFGQSEARRVQTGTRGAEQLLLQFNSSPTGTVRRRPVVAKPQAPTVQAKRRRRPIPKVDPFKRDYAQWKTNQQAFTRSFEAFSNPRTGTGKEALEKLAFDTALQNTTAALGGLAPDGKGRAPNLSERRLREGQKDVNNAYLMEGKSGKILGVMRKLLGGTYVKAVNLYASVDKKLKDFWDGRRSRFSGGGSLGKTMLRVGGKLLLKLFTLLLPEIGRVLMDCVEAGFSGLMDRAVENIKDAPLAGSVDAILQDLEAQALEIEAQIESMADEIFAKMEVDYEGLLSKLQAAGKLVAVAKAAINAGRLIACVAGGVETVGIACIAAGIDFLLGLVGLSPTEMLVSSVLESCRAQKFIAEELLALESVKAVPQKIAGVIIGVLRPRLGEISVAPPAPLPTFTLDEILCDTFDGDVDMPQADEFDCNEPSSGGGSAANGPILIGDGSADGGGTAGAGATNDTGGGDGSGTGATPQTRQGGGEQEAAADQVLIVRDPEHIDQDMSNSEGLPLNGVILSGIDVAHPPARGTHHTVRLRIRIAGYVVTHNQEIVFDSLVPNGAAQDVRFYLPEAGDLRTDATVGPYAVGTQAFNYHRGETALYTMPVQGSN